jgi:hypothetical protein
MGVSRRWMLVLIAAVALLVGALAVPLRHVSGTTLAGTTELVASAPLGDPSSFIVPPPAPRQPAQVSTWLWSITGEHLPDAALLASLLLAVVCLTGPLARLARALPPRRGPPTLALLR